MVSIDSDETIEFEDDRAENRPEVVTDQKETTKLMKEILGGLSEEQRLAVSLYYFEELSVKEIADILSVSEGTVKSRLNYGRKKIEIGVKALEKKGTKLYGLAPIPFLLLLFRSQDVYAAELPDIMVLQAVQKNLSTGVSFTYNGNTARNIGRETAKNIGKEAVKTTAKAVGKGVLTKVIAGVAIASVIGAGAFGITSINKEDKKEVVQETVEQETVTEIEKKEELDLQDFSGVYYCDDYYLKLSSHDGETLTISSGVMYKEKTTIVYFCDEFQIEGNTLIGKYSEKVATDLQIHGSDEMINEEGSERYKLQEGTDTFILNDDGTLTANFEGIVGETGRSGVYCKKGTFPVQNVELETFLGEYIGENYFCMLTYEGGVLYVATGTPTERNMYGYSYEEIQIEGDTLTAVYKDYAESASGELVEKTDTYLINEDCSLVATFTGIMEDRSGTYFRYTGEEPSLKDNNIAESNEYEEVLTTSNVYGDIISDFGKIVEYRLSDDYYVVEADGDKIVYSDTIKKAMEKNAIGEDNISYQWDCMIAELPSYCEGLNAEEFGYIIYDMNNDGISELFFVGGNHTILAVFTLVNEEPVLLKAFWSRHQGVISEEGFLICFSSSGAYDNKFYVYSLNSNGVLEVQYGTRSESDYFNRSIIRYYIIEGGEENSVSFDEYEEYKNTIRMEPGAFWLMKEIIPLDEGAI